MASHFFELKGASNVAIRQTVDGLLDPLSIPGPAHSKCRTRIGPGKCSAVALELWPVCCPERCRIHSLVSVWR